MNLMNLDEYNSLRRKLYSDEPQPNGIACPQCGEELYDPEPMVVLTSYPPQKRVICMKKDCGYSGYRIA
jgi:hypothetical protein